METCPRHRISYAPGSYCPGCVATTALMEDAEEQETPIAVLGDYELISELGRGGMGVVYLARQTGLNRRVALKLLPSGNLAGQEFIQRFRREGELAASLQHPHIVRIFEAGQAEGELFYSMELITGGSLADWKDGKTHRPRDAAKLLRLIALAVDHAHQNGILHRDLKPSNILIDEDGNPKIADFGLARLLDSQHEITLTSHSFGSPAYLAPELIRDPRAAAPASDIYSLGAILYFLLTGRSPFVSASLDELLRQVRELEPPPPRILNPSVPKDLQKICLKALDKNPAKRYLTAREIADDLQRFLDNRPVLAQPAGPFIKSVRFARRSPWLTASLGLLALALIGGIGGIIRQSKLANQRADETARKAGELRLNLYASDISAASTALRRGDTPLADQILSRWENPAPGEDLRGFEWRLLREQSRPTPHYLVDRRPATITQIAISPDGQEIAVADQSGKVLIHPRAATVPFSANELATIPSSLGGGWVFGTSDGEVHWFDSDLRPIAKFPGRQFSLATDLPRAVVGILPRFHWNRKAGAASVIDWKTGQTLRHFPGEWRHAVISPDGKSVALAGLDGGLRITDIETGTIRGLPTQSPVWALSFNHDGTKVSAGSRRAAIIWDLSDASPAPLVMPHDLTVWTTAFSSDGSRFLTSSSDRQVRVWRTDQLSSPPVTLSGHRSEVWCAAFSPDGKTVIAGGKDGDVLGWHLDDPGTSSEIVGHDHSSPPFISADGRHLATSRQNRGRIIDLTSQREITLPAGIVSLGSSPDGRTLYCSDSENRTGIADAMDPTKITFHAAPQPASASRRIRVIGNGRWIARVEDSGEVRLLRPSDGVVIHRLKAQRPGMRHCVAGSPDGSFVAIGGDGEKSLVLHHLVTGSTFRLGPPSSYYYVCAAFSEDGTLLAAGDLSGPIRIWEVRTRRLVATLPGHPEETSAVAFNPDGRTLASMGHLQDLKLWHTATWRELHSVNLPDAGYHLAFTPDGKSLIATMGRDRSERIQWFPLRGKIGH